MDLLPAGTFPSMMSLSSSLVMGVGGDYSLHIIHDLQWQGVTRGELNERN